MRFLSISWGDGTANTETQSKFGLRDKPDLNDPFIFPHVYTYNAARPESVGGQPNIFTVTIKVRDNWDWCACPKAPIQCQPNDCNDPVDSVITVGTIIEVSQ